MEVYGLLIDWFETGSEGIHWAIQRGPAGAVKGASYNDLFFIEDSDYLEIYCPSTLYTDLQRKVVWSGDIKKYFSSLSTQSPRDPEYKQQNVCGQRVKWLQQDFNDHEQWFWYFTLSYPAKLVRTDK